MHYLNNKVVTKQSKLADLMVLLPMGKSVGRHLIRHEDLSTMETFPLFKKHCKKSLEGKNELGVKWDCPFNILTKFHATTSFPFDILHDLSEGVMSLDVKSALRICIQKKIWFSLTEYNETMKSAGVKFSDKKDEPKELKFGTGADKINGKAMNVNCHA